MPTYPDDTIGRSAGKPATMGRNAVIFEFVTLAPRQKQFYLLDVTRQDPVSVIRPLLTIVKHP